MKLITAVAILACVAASSKAAIVNDNGNGKPVGGMSDAIVSNSGSGNNEIPSMSYAMPSDGDNKMSASFALPTKVADRRAAAEAEAAAAASASSASFFLPTKVADKGDNKILSGVTAPTTTPKTGCCKLHNARNFMWTKPVTHDECMKISKGNASPGTYEFATEEEKAAVATLKKHEQAKAARKASKGATETTLDLPGKKQPLIGGSPATYTPTKPLIGGSAGVYHGNANKYIDTSKSRRLRAASDVNGVTGFTSGIATGILPVIPSATSTSLDLPATKMSLDLPATKMSLDLPSNSYASGNADGLAGITWTESSGDSTCGAAEPVKTKFHPFIGTAIPQTPLLGASLLGASKH